MVKTMIPSLFSNEDVDFPIRSFFDEWTNWVPFRAQGGGIGISEDNDAFYVEAPVPGLKVEEIKVSLKDHILSISGERQEEKKSAQVHRKMASKYAFQISLPETVDQSAPVDAHLENGVLKVRLSKSHASKPKSIEVKVR